MTHLFTNELTLPLVHLMSALTSTPNTSVSTTYVVVFEVSDAVSDICIFNNIKAQQFPGIECDTTLESRPLYSNARVQYINEMEELC